MPLKYSNFKYDFVLFENKISKFKLFKIHPQENVIWTSDSWITIFPKEIFKKISITSLAGNFQVGDTYFLDCRIFYSINTVLENIKSLISASFTLRQGSLDYVTII